MNVVYLPVKTIAVYLPGIKRTIFLDKIQRIY
jgi:hypothetical protein